MAAIEDKVAEKVALRVLYDIDGTLTSSDESGISEAMKTFHERYMALLGSIQPDYITARSRGELLNNLWGTVGGISSNLEDASDVGNLKERLEKNFRQFEQGHTDNILKIFGEGRVCSPMDLDMGENGLERKPGDYFVNDLQDFEPKSVKALKGKLFNYIDENANKHSINSLASEVMHLCTAFKCEYEKEKIDYERGIKKNKTKADQLRLYAKYNPADTYVIFEDMPVNIKDLLALNDDENFPAKVIVIQATPEKTAQDYWKEISSVTEIMSIRFENIRKAFQTQLNVKNYGKEIKDLCDVFVLMSADFSFYKNIQKHLVELKRIVQCLEAHSDFKDPNGSKNFKAIVNDMRDFYDILAPEIVPEKKSSSSLQIIESLQRVFTPKKKTQHHTYHGNTSRVTPPQDRRVARSLFSTPQHEKRKSGENNRRQGSFESLIRGFSNNKG